MRNYKNIILIVVLVLALGFLIFSIGFYMTKRSQVAVKEEPTVTQPESQPTQPPAGPVAFTDEWSRAFSGARLAMDPAKCGAISDALGRQDCQDKVNLLIAYRDNDMGRCRAVVGASLRDSCYINLGFKLDIDYCDYLSDEISKKSCQDEQLLNKVVSQNDLNKCMELEGDSRQYCLYKIIRKFDNISQCGAVADADLQEYCRGRF